MKTSRGVSLRLGSLIGRGGEGSVYAVEGGQGLAAKLYQPDKALDRRPKVAAMIAQDLYRKCPVASFPTEMLFDQTGKFIGFTMRQVNAHRPFHELYGPADRKVEFPAADFRSLVYTAANIARAVAQVHHSNCVIGDINHSGILVSEKATAALIDADSFQVTTERERFLCKVGVPDYTPPELQGAPLDSTIRQQHHDAFGLAVCIFQLLFMGRHPFAGRYQRGDMPIHQAIKDCRFAYSTQRDTGMRAPPNVPTLRDFPLTIASHFENAFGPVGPLGLRPTAMQWVGALVQLERDLKSCPNNNRHYYFKGAANCPWCLMEQRSSGLILFLPLPGTAPLSTPTKQPTVQNYWAKLNAVQSPGAAPSIETLLGLGQLPSIDAGAYGLKEWCAKVGGIFSGFIAVALLQSNFVGTLIMGGIAWWLFRYQDAGRSAARARLAAAQKQWTKLTTDWMHRAGDGKFLETKQELKEQNAALAQLHQQEARRLQELETNKHAAQMEAWLDQHHISRASIPGIGATRKQTLASYGIETAWDVSYSKVFRVPGFGEKKTRDLLAWRALIERKFVFNPNAKTDPRLIASIRAEYAQKRAPIEAQLQRGAATLESIRQTALTLRKSVTPELRAALQELRDASAALRNA